MSTCCTLHPLDPRLAESLEKSILGRKPDWSFLWLNYHQKRTINRVNQRIKAHLPDLLADASDYDPEIHQWGRPFLITADKPETVTHKIETLYQTSNWLGVLRMYLDELAVLNDKAVTQAAAFQFPEPKTAPLGLDLVIRDLQHLFKIGKYEDAGLEIPFVLAQLAGLTYPYWYLNGFGISFLEQLRPPGWVEEPNGLTALFLNLPQLEEHFPRRLEHQLSTGVYLDPEEVTELLEIIETKRDKIVNLLALKQFTTAMARKVLQKTTEALTYAKLHHYGLLEATDVFEAGVEPYP